MPKIEEYSLSAKTMAELEESTKDEVAKLQAKYAKNLDELAIE